MSCRNCDGVMWKRERGLFRDIDFCLTCGFTCEALGTGLTLATAVSAFVLGAIGSDRSGPFKADHSQA